MQESDKLLVKDGSKRAAVDILQDVGNKKRILGDITNQPKITNLKPSVVTRKGSKIVKYNSESSIASVTTSKKENFISKDSVFEKESKNVETSTEDSMYTTALEDRYFY